MSKDSKLSWALTAGPLLMALHAGCTNNYYNYYGGGAEDDALPGLVDGAAAGLDAHAQALESGASDSHALADAADSRPPVDAATQADGPGFADAAQDDAPSSNGCPGSEPGRDGD